MLVFITLFTLIKSMESSVLNGVEQLKCYNKKNKINNLNKSWNTKPQGGSEVTGQSIKIYDIIECPITLALPDVLYCFKTCSSH